MSEISQSTTKTILLINKFFNLEKTTYVAQSRQENISKTDIILGLCDIENERYQIVNNIITKNKK